MSERLLQVDGFTSLIANRPIHTTGVAQDVWDDLVRLITEAVKKVVDELIKPIGTKIKDVYDAVTIGIKNKLDDVQKYVKTLIDDVIKTIGDGINSLYKSVKGWIDDTRDAIQTAIGGIVDTIKTAIASVVNKLQDIIAKLQSVAQEIVRGVKDAINDFASSIRDGIKYLVDGISKWIKSVIDFAVGQVKTLIDGVKNWILSLLDFVKEQFLQVYYVIQDWINGVYEHLKNAYESAKATIEKTLGDILDWLKWVWNELNRFVGMLLSEVADWINYTAIPFFRDRISELEIVWKAIDKIWGLLYEGKFQEAFDLVDAIFKGIGLPAPISVIKTIVSTMAYFYLSVRLQFVPLEISAQRQAVINLALEPVGLGDAARALLRGEISKDDYYYNARLAGITKDRADMVIEAARAIPSPGAIQEAFMRGDIDEQTHDRYLKDYGYTDKDIVLFKSLYWLIPTPTDLIRMAVREAFSPDIAEKFGQYEDFPKPFAEWASKQGLSEEWAKRYWASHWDLPSPTMGFEMLHRGIIDEDELKLLLRALDVMPYWRERLIKLSYNPITRVDLRRMYQMGVMTEDDVYRGYLDLGYKPEDARRLTEFTKRYSAPEDESEQDKFRALARGVYSQAYKRKIISKDEYRSMLESMRYSNDDIELLIQIDDFAILQSDKLFDVGDYRKDMRNLVVKAYDRGVLSHDDIRVVLTDLGYDDTEINLEIQLADYARALRIKSIVVDRLHDQYVSYIIDNVQLHTIFDSLGFTSSEVEHYLEEWEVERSFRTKRPPLSDIKRFMNAELITLDEYLDELRGEGYHEKYIKLYEQMLRD